MKKSISFIALSALAFSIGAGLVFAHATVKPSEVGIGKYQTFALGVPTEKESNTISVRLVVPENLASITPNVKPGWKIEIKKQSTGKMVEHDGMQVPEERVSEVVWTGGSIPHGQRDEFLFSAKSPAEAGEVVWKIHQTYADGSVVSWELDPGVPQPQKDGKPDFSSKGPASVTKVVDDLAVSMGEQKMDDTQVSKVSAPQSGNRLAQTSLVLSAVSVIASAFALGTRKS